jgi:hypothetical protein
MKSRSAEGEYSGRACRVNHRQQHTTLRSVRIKSVIRRSCRSRNAIQIGGLLGGMLLARRAGKQGRHGTRSLYAGRLLAFFCEHAFSHYAIGRLGGIRFTGYGLHGSTHRRLYPPGMRWVFTHLPFLNARIDLASRRAAAPPAQAAMYVAGPLVTVLVSILFPVYGLIHGIARARALLIGSGLWMLGMLISELVHTQGDLRRAWRAIRDR